MAQLAIMTMIVIGTAVVALIAWLSNRTSIAFRVGGAVLAGLVTIYCLTYVVALVAEFGDAGTPKLASAAMIAVFAATSSGAVLAAFRGFGPRTRPSPSS